MDTLALVGTALAAPPPTSPVRMPRMLSAGSMMRSPKAALFASVRASPSEVRSESSVFDSALASARSFSATAGTSS